jgi:hypothetical protein
MQGLPRSTTAAAAILAAESAAAVLTGVAFAVAALVGHPHDRGTAVLLGALLAVLGGGCALVARGLWHGHPRASTPAYLAQFFGLVVAWYQRSTLLPVAIALAVVCLAAVVALGKAQRS